MHQHRQPGKQQAQPRDNQDKRPPQKAVGVQIFVTAIVTQQQDGDARRHCAKQCKDGTLGKRGIPTAVICGADAQIQQRNTRKQHEAHGVPKERNRQQNAEAKAQQLCFEVAPQAKRNKEQHEDIVHNQAVYIPQRLQAKAK